MAVGDRGQACVAGVTVPREGALAELLAGRPCERAVEGIQFGEGADIGWGVALGKGPSGRLVAVIWSAALGAVWGDQTGELLAGKAGHLDQVTPHQPRVGAF